MKTLTFLLALFFAQAFFAQGAGKAIQFDGTNDYINCGNDASLQITGAITLEAWVKLTETTSWDAIISKAFWDDNLGRYDNTAYELKFNGSTNKVNFWFSQSGDETNNMDVTGNTALTVGKWYHVAAVFSPSSFVKIYVNGIEDASVTTGVVSSIYNSTRPLYLGLGAHTTGGEYLHGCLDEVRIWNVALTADQIRAMMCKKLTSSNLPSGVSWSNLKGYWRFDEGNGTTTNDQTSNNNDGTFENGPTWINSGAAIGDASAYDYSSPTSVTLSHSNGDYVNVSAITGSPDGVQIYRVDGAPNVTTPPGNMTQLFTSRYWGVKIIGGSSSTYTLTYYYNGNPDIGSYENYQDLAKRSDNSSTAWTEGNATLNTSAKTLTLTGQTGTEYIDGREDNATPVELTTFTATAQNGNVTLKWQSATEINNYGFEIQRLVSSPPEADQRSEFETIGFVEGAGNCNSPKEYSFTDKNPPLGRLQYRLKQIDIDGQFEYSEIVEVVTEAPTKFELFQNYPNPFNPTTNITYVIASPDLSGRGNLPNGQRQIASSQAPRNDATVQVSLKVYDALGREVATLVNAKQTPGKYSVQFNASKLGSGVYFYALRAGNFIQIRKMVLMK